MTFSKIEEKSNDCNSALQWIVFKIDLDLNLLFLNQNGHEKTGYNEEDVKKGLKLHDVFPPEDTKRMSENLKKICECPVTLN